MSKILSHPFYIESKKLEDSILKDIDMNLSKLDATYKPTNSDNKLFYPYGDNYVLFSTFNYFHPHYFFEIGRGIIEKVEEHESRLGLGICKEGLYSIMAVCAIQKNDVLNYRVYTEKALIERSKYSSTTPLLIDLIKSEPIFGSINREATRVVESNSIVVKMKTYFPDISFIEIADNLQNFQQQQFVNYILNYRLLHYYLDKADCPAIAFEHCYSLVQNLCVLFESALKTKKSSTKQLWNLISQDTNAPYKTILTTGLNLISIYPTHSISDFNTHYPNILIAFDAETNPDNLIVYSEYILYMCRNQILHNLTDTACFHGNGQATEKLIGILIFAIYSIRKL